MTNYEKPGIEQLKQKRLHGSVKIDTWISLSCFMDLPELFHGFFKVVTWICLVILSISCSLSNKTKVKFDQDFKAC